MRIGTWKSIGALALGTAIAGRTYGAMTTEDERPFPWSAGASVGVMIFEGDEWVKSAPLLTGRLSYEVNSWWNWEGFLFLVPRADAKSRPTRDRNPDWDSCWMIGAGGEGVLHLIREWKLDPYLAAGAHLRHTSEELETGHQWELGLRAGGGVLWHLNDEWAIRADGRFILSGPGNGSEGNGILEIGADWTWGARVPPKLVAAGGALDSDGDGLTDVEEREVYKTDSFKPDTDGDGLTDYEEVMAVHGSRTDPLNPDTDSDGLLDGAEVHIVGTNPLKWDTDEGGVSDGHEALEDGTDPLFKADDLIRHTLYLNFDTDQAVIKPQYFRELEIVGRTLARDPGATAKIEGHADRRRRSGAQYNKDLSLRRANAVKEHLAVHYGIDRTRMTTTGYGFERPIAPNDPVNGHPLNRRVEVYIRLSDHPVSPRVRPTIKREAVEAPALGELNEPEPAQ